MNDAEALSDGYFDGFTTRKYHNRNPLQRALIRRFVRCVDVLVCEARQGFRLTSPLASALEIGCGEGFLLGHFVAKHADMAWAGVEPRANDVGRLRARFPHLRVQQDELCALTPEHSRSDLIVCCEVLEHVPEPDVALVAMRNLSPKRLVISVPHEPWFMLSNLARGKNLTRLGNDPEHLHLFTRSRLRRLLEKHFTVLRLTRSYPWLLALLAP